MRPKVSRFREGHGISMKLLSAIVPCYNEEENIADFYHEFIKNEVFFKEKEVELEIWYIDDGSKDGTVSEIKKLIQKDGRVHLLSFSRNFGKEAAIYAGLEKANGDYVVFLDADLQDPPALLPEMFGFLKEGYDSVATRRVTRKGEPPIRSFFARMFYRLMRKISKTEIMDGARDYRLMTRQVVDSILSIHEYNRFSKGIFGWVGFETKWLEFENIEREKPNGLSGNCFSILLTGLPHFLQHLLDLRLLWAYFFVLRHLPLSFLQLSEKRSLEILLPAGPHWSALFP